MLKFVDGLWRLIALHYQPGVWKPAAPEFGADAPRVEGRRGTFDDLYGDWPKFGDQRKATLDLDSLGLIDDVGPNNIAALAQSSDYLATTIMNGLSILTKAVEITWVLTKLPSDRLQSVGNVSKQVSFL